MKRLNVLQFIIPTGFYGAERWVLALANNFSSAEVACHLAVTSEFESQDLEITRQYPEKCGAVFTLEMSGAFDPFVLKKLVNVIRTHEIDIIHTHGYKSDLLGVIAAKYTGIKAVSTPHGFGISETLKSKIYKVIGLRAMRYFDAVVPLSPDLSAELIANKIPEKKISYIQNGVDLSEVLAVKDVELKSEQLMPSGIKVGFIGQFIKRKGIDHIIRAFDLAWRTNKDWQLILIGDGVERQNLEDIAKSLPCSSNIHFLGFRADRLQILKQLDIFTMASESEGIPRCMMEAMAIGIPTVAFDIDGVDRLIEHNKTGYLAPYGDIEELCALWKRTVEEKTQTEKMIINASSFVENEFSAKRMADEYQSLFTALLSGSDTTHTVTQN